MIPLPSCFRGLPGLALALLIGALAVAVAEPSPSPATERTASHG